MRKSIINNITKQLSVSRQQFSILQSSQLLCHDIHNTIVQNQQQQYNYSIHVRSDSPDNNDIHSGITGVNVWSSVNTNNKSIEELKKELLWRSKQRGILELDLLIGTYCNQHIHSWNNNQLQQFERILDIESPDLLQIVLKKQDIPDELKGDVLDDIMKYTHQQTKQWNIHTGNQNI